MIYANMKSLKSSDYQGNLKKAIEYLIDNYSSIKSQDLGKYEVCEEFFYMVQEYTSKDSTPWESHKKYIDIQLIMSGEEKMDVTHKDYLKQIIEYNAEKDWIEYEGDVQISMKMSEGDLAVFFPEDAHQPGLKTEKGNSTVRKCLFKVLV